MSYVLTLLLWLAQAVVGIALLITVPFVTPIIALFTEAAPHGQAPYFWGGLWGTWDNPPQGDEGFVSKRSFFPNVVTGWRGYVNRVQWMWRNKLYGYSKLASIAYAPELQLSFIGNPHISDKYKIPGYYFATLKRGSKLVAFELYAVLPYSSTRDVRIRFGWKFMTDKFKQYGFAQHVHTFNPFDGYGDN